MNYNVKLKIIDLSRGREQNVGAMPPNFYVSSRMQYTSSFIVKTCIVSNGKLVDEM